MSSLFPLPPTSERSKPGGGVRETLVVWDIEDYSIPESIDPCLINEKIKTSIIKDPFLRRTKVSILIYGATENTWLTVLRDKLWESGFEVYLYKGDKRVRLNMILADVVYRTWSWKAPRNFLMLSENKERIEQDPKFCRFRQALENKGSFVASAHPDTIINQETAVEEPPDYYSPIPCYVYASDDPKDDTLKLAYWHREYSEAFRAKEVHIRSMTIWKDFHPPF